MQMLTRGETRHHGPTYVEGKANSAWTHLWMMSFVERNAAMHGNIQHGQLHVLNHAQWGEFSFQGNNFSAQSTDMFQNIKKQT